jgi:hypothetical protein
LISVYMRTARTVLLVLCAIGVFAGTAAERLERDDLVVLEGATLIDATGAGPREGSVVVIRGSRILRVGKMGEFRYSEKATTINLTGRWIVPGFMDLHAHMDHLDGPLPPVEVLGTLLRFGITTFRSPAAGPGAGTELRDRIAAGEIAGPRMFAAGRLIDLPDGRRRPFAVEITSVAEVRAEVRRQAAAGVDWVKFYNKLSPELLRAGIEEARAAGLRTIAHLGATGWAEAARLGIDAVVHCGAAAPTWELVPPERRSPFLEFYVPRPNFDATLFAPWWRAVDLDGAHFKALVAVLAERGVEVNPTLVLLESMYWGDERRLLEELEPEYAPSAIARRWRKEAHYTEAWPAEAREAAKRTFAVTLEMVRRLHEGGVLLTAGTDMANPWLTPGVSFHRELWLLQRSGIPALDVLTIATRNGAKALGILHDVGTIEAGKRADLLVLSANPLADIRNTRAIAAVYLGGRRVDGGAGP